jgi:hypothetical protein
VVVIGQDLLQLVNDEKDVYPGSMKDTSFTMKRLWKKWGVKPGESKKSWPHGR